ncbi:HAD family hydrolase [Glycomyces tarimensis]
MKLDRQEALAECSLLLLDFDGPLCALFSGYPSGAIAAKMIEIVRGIDPRLANEMAGETSPMAVLLTVAENLPKKTVDRMDEFLCAEEMRAVDSAAATPGVAELMEASRREGRTIGIVSNNCPRAIAKYLNREGLDAHVSIVVGRPYGRPRRMKPDPYLIRQALGYAGVDAARACFIGDSVTDIEAGNAVGVATIGFANETGKGERLRKAGAGLVVTEF